MITKNCKQCGDKFSFFASRRRRYCSRKCSNKDNKQFVKGVPHLWIRGSKNPNWKNGVHRHSHGYIHIYSPNHPFKDVRNYVPEHRLKMEKKIGRYLFKEEVVHHINGKKDDNRLSNLKLFSSNAEHIKYEYINTPEIKKKMKKFHFKKGKTSLFKGHKHTKENKIKFSILAKNRYKNIHNFMSINNCSFKEAIEKMQ